MNRPLTALFAALEALLVVGIGIGIPLVPLTILWAFQYGLAINWLVFWRASVDIWLLGSGADVSVTLDPTIATSVGLAGAGTPFVLTIALLGFALLSILLGVRAGGRIAETPFRQFGVTITVLTFAVLALLATVTASHPLAQPSIWQGVLLPTVIYAVGVFTGSEITRRRSVVDLEQNGSSIRDWVNDWPEHLRVVAASALRAGAAAAAAILAIASVLVTAMIVLGYARIISLYEEVHAGVMGGITLTLGQLAFLPNLVIWAASWLVGPGFAIGTGSAVSPLGTHLGPIPAIPILGALPTGELVFGFLGLLVPVLAGFLAGVVIQPRLTRAIAEVSRLPWLIATGVLTGIVGGVLLGLLAWASAGSAGPGRLVDVGPSPILVGLYAAVEIGVAAGLGIFVSGVRASATQPSSLAAGPR